MAELVGSACGLSILQVPSGDGLSDELLLVLLLADVPRGGGRVGLLLSHRRTLSPWQGWDFGSNDVEVLEVGAKASMTTSADIVSFLETPFPISPPIVPDVVGENLPLTGYLVSALVLFPPWRHG